MLVVLLQLLPLVMSPMLATGVPGLNLEPMCLACKVGALFLHVLLLFGWGSVSVRSAQEVDWLRRGSGQGSVCRADAATVLRYPSIDGAACTGGWRCMLPSHPGIITS
ncbi:hypothetical protein C8J57DRAFT_1235749 [Mycena rebaudengoi]|nr:hypothetical protein C8J57DRAFT_1235749 [Mycena rebaudengoi]